MVEAGALESEPPRLNLVSVQLTFQAWVRAGFPGVWVIDFIAHEPSGDTPRSTRTRRVVEKGGAETQTFVSSRTTGFTTLGFHFRTRRGDLCLDIRRSVASCPPMDAIE